MERPLYYIYKSSIWQWPYDANPAVPVEGAVGAGGVTTSVLATGAGASAAAFSSLGSSFKKFVIDCSPSNVYDLNVELE